jgi:hypothetical protein
MSTSPNVMTTVPSATGHESFSPSTAVANTTFEMSCTEPTAVMVVAGVKLAASHPPRQLLVCKEIAAF